MIKLPLVKVLSKLPDGTRIPSKVMNQIPKFCAECSRPMQTKKGWTVFQFSGKTGKPDSYQAELKCSAPWYIWLSWQLHDTKLAVWSPAGVLPEHVTVLTTRHF